MHSIARRFSLAGAPAKENSDSYILPEMPGNTVPARKHLFAASSEGYMVIKDEWKYSRYFNGLQVLNNLQTDPNDTVNCYNDPNCKKVMEELQKIMQQEIDQSIQFAHREKFVAGRESSGGGAFSERHWKRTYPSTF